MFPDPILYGSITGSRAEITRTGSRKSGMVVKLDTLSIGQKDLTCSITATYNKKTDSIDINMEIVDSKTKEVLKQLLYKEGEIDT